MSETPNINPVNAIAELLTEAPVKEMDEVTVLDGATTNKETPDENQQESLEEGAQEIEAADENPVETDEEVVDTLNNLAEELDIDISDMYALNVKFAEGEDTTIGQLKDFFESNRDIEATRNTMKEREAALESEAQLIRDIPQVTNELLQARANVLAIQSQYDNTNWEGLRQQDPGQYAALQQDYRTQFEIAKAQEAAAGTTATEHQAQARHLQQERLFDAVPQLKDEGFRQATITGVNELTAKYGFSPTDVANIEDHRLMRLLIDASKIVKATDTAKEKLIDDAPTTSLKPSPRKQAPTTRNAALKRLTEKAKQTNDRRDQTAAVAALLNS